MCRRIRSGMLGGRYWSVTTPPLGPSVAVSCGAVDRVVDRPARAWAAQKRAVGVQCEEVDRRGSPPGTIRRRPEAFARSAVAPAEGRRRSRHDGRERTPARPGGLAVGDRRQRRVSGPGVVRILRQDELVPGVVEANVVGTGAGDGEERPARRGVGRHSREHRQGECRKQRSGRGPTVIEIFRPRTLMPRGCGVSPLSNAAAPTMSGMNADSGDWSRSRRSRSIAARKSAAVTGWFEEGRSGSPAAP